MSHSHADIAPIVVFIDAVPEFYFVGDIPHCRLHSGSTTYELVCSRHHMADGMRSAALAWAEWARSEVGKVLPFRRVLHLVSLEID